MKVLVTGGTGTVGSRVVEGLLKRGVEVLVMTRAKEKLAHLPTGTSGVVADPEKPGTLPAAFEGAEGVFLLLALGRTETEQGLAAVEAAKKAGARRLVYMSVMMPEDSKHIPHFKSKIPIEQAVRASGAEFTILRPNSFFQNDLRAREAIYVHGVYPHPIGMVGVSAVDVRDIADAAVHALTEDGHAGQTYPLNGPRALTGDDVARIYSSHLKREVRYAGDDLNAWAKQAESLLPKWLIDDLRVMYQYFQEFGFRAADGDLVLQQKVVGHPPRSFDDFVGELAPAWKG
jgi:uncharacterized protein YbjT (DUF2867 family)